MKHSSERDSIACAFELDKGTPPTIYQSLHWAKNYASLIAGLYPQLRRTLEKFEAVIRKRWAKENQKARGEVLDKAWEKPSVGSSGTVTEMLRTRRSDLAASVHECSDDVPEYVYLFHHLNHEDLVKGKTFLRLLNSRGRHEPAVFALSDLESSQLGRWTGAVPFDFIPRVMDMDLSSDMASGNYGMVHPEGKERTDDIIKGRAFNAADGLIVLRIQYHTLKFLTECCHIILHDRIAEINDNQTPTVAEPEPLPAHDEDTDSTVHAAGQRPYRVPHADLEEMLSLARAALEDAEAHAWALHEDPSYYVGEAKELKENSAEYFKDTRGEHHHVVRDRNIFWGLVTRRMVREAYGAVLDWQLIVHLLEAVADQDKAFTTKFGPTALGEDDADFFISLLWLRHALDDIILPADVRLLNRRLKSNPPYRHLFKRRAPRSAFRTPDGTGGG